MVEGLQQVRLCGGIQFARIEHDHIGQAVRQHCLSMEQKVEQAAFAIRTL